VGRSRKAGRAGSFFGVFVVAIVSAAGIVRCIGSRPFSRNMQDALSSCFLSLQLCFHSSYDLQA
jgi:hypothetical protein